MISQTKWVNVKELATYLRCSESFLYHAVSANKIPHSKKSGLKFYLPAIDAWMMGRDEDCAGENNLIRE